MTLEPGTPFRISSSAIDDGPAYYKTEGVNPDFPVEDWFMRNLTEPRVRDIQINADWANLALPPEFTVEKVISAFGHNISGPRETDVRPALSFIVTDALARFGASTEVVIASLNPPRPSQIDAEYHFMQDSSTLDLSNLTPIRVTRDRYGYNYSTSGTTRRLAIAVMFIHISIALTYTILVVWYRWWCPGLQSLSDFFVLAVNSSMPESPGDTCSQLELSSKKHEYNIQVREVGDEKLEMEIRGKYGTESYTSDDNERSGMSGTEP
ncbi:hypothetical protein DL98DRAFT_520913 [Cadophora sp. DSE1049]|nr:hypothetical protein DL98DRAFT_520913 [Cadophora sp. DSE1049]